MSDKKTTIIITDGQDSTGQVAEAIKAALSNFDVKTLGADKFEGTDILPCELFFIGCEKPSPSSFAYLEEMLSHINFASRKCGVFSASAQAIDYIQNLLKPCEAACPRPLLVTDAKNCSSDVKKWINQITG